MSLASPQNLCPPNMSQLQAPQHQRSTKAPPPIQLPPFDHHAGPSHLEACTTSESPTMEEGETQWIGKRRRSLTGLPPPHQYRHACSEEIDIDRHPLDYRPTIPSPTWPYQWAEREPSSRPLRAPSAGPSMTSRRHHPYGAQQSASTATPSPTWPAHIGLEEAQQRSANTPSVLRPRASTVVLPRPAELSTAYPVRPPMSARAQSSQLPSERSPPAPYDPRMPQHHTDTHYDSRRGSYATNGSATDGSYHPYPHSHPHSHSHQSQSSLLFSPLSESQEHHSQPRPNTLSVPPIQPPQPPYRSSGVTPLITDRLTMADDKSPHGSFFPLSPYDQPRQFANSGHLSPYDASPSLRSEGWPPARGEHPGLHHQPSLERMNQSTRKRRRPPYSYSSLIVQAITSTPQQRMTLREIYTWISNSYPELYSMDSLDSQGWQNTVRHNLSLNKIFVKVARTARDIYEGSSSANPAQSQAARGKGGWWTIDPVVAAAQLGPNFRGGVGGPMYLSGETSPQTPMEELAMHNRRRSSTGLPPARDRNDSLSGTSSDEPESPPARIPSVLIKDPVNMARPVPSRADGPSPSIETSSRFRPGVDVPSVLARTRPASVVEGGLAYGHGVPAAARSGMPVSAPSTSPNGVYNPGLGFDGFKMPSVMAIGQAGRTRGYTTSSSREIRPVASHSSLSSTYNARLLPSTAAQRSVSGGHGETRRPHSASDPIAANADDDSMARELPPTPISAPAAMTFIPPKEADSDMDDEAEEKEESRSVVKVGDDDESEEEEGKRTTRMSIRDLLC